MARRLTPGAKFVKLGFLLVLMLCAVCPPLGCVVIPFLLFLWLIL